MTETVDTARRATWQTIAILVARLVFTGLFAMAVTLKLLDINATATFIAAAGFPLSWPLTWIAAGFETVLVLCFLTGAFLRRRHSWPPSMSSIWPSPFTVLRTGRGTNSARSSITSQSWPVSSMRPCTARGEF